MPEAEFIDVLVIGGGPAGLAAALGARGAGAGRVCVLERDAELGGILNQCIHNGFGLHYFHEELTGPEYAGRFIEKLAGAGIEVSLGDMALSLSPVGGGAANGWEVRAVSRARGCRILRARSVVLAMGCRERTRGMIGIPGTRPAGVFTAGAAQRYVNLEGCMVGRRALILGSGDIGLIMARRLTLEGAEVLACVEVMPYPGGLARNRAQCLDDFGIPLLLSHTIVEIRGARRVEGAVVARVDARRRPVPGTETEYACDTILLSVGLIPENELTRCAGIPLDPHTGGAVVRENMETLSPGVFACGNVAQVHDLVDNVTAEAERAGAAAAAFARGERAAEEPALAVAPGEGVSYTLPQRIRVRAVERAAEISFRVKRPFGPCTVAVRSKEAPLCSFMRERAAPGEMEHIVLPRSLLDKAREGIIISMEEKNPEEKNAEGGERV